MRPLIEDFPSQFKGKPKIEALCACFDRQFAEIEQCFQQLLLLLDIEKASSWTGSGTSSFAPVRKRACSQRRAASSTLT